MSSAKKCELGTGVAVGLVVGGVLATVIAITDLSFSAPIGALVGGACTSYLVYEKIGRSTIAGGLSGLLSLPFFLGLSQIFLIFGLIAVPSGSQPSFTELQSAVVTLIIMNFLAGAVGGSIVAAVRRPTVVHSEPVTATSTGPARYCVQCGAKLSPGKANCPHCGAGQPEMSV